MNDQPTPATRRKSPTIRGTPTTLGDGREWLPADWIPHLGPVWDRLYDWNVTRGQYEPADVLLAAVRLLLANYDLSDDEVTALVLGADAAALVPAVEAALFGPPGRRHFSDWVKGALLANHIDPAALPPGALHLVLEQLVLTGRAAAPEHYVSSARHAAQRNKLSGLAR